MSYPQQQERFKHQSEIIKYFVQGLPFAIMSTGTLWLFDFILLNMFFVDFATLISTLFVMAIVLTLVLGATNSIIASALWDIKPRQTCTSFGGQGLLLVFMAYIVGPFFVFLFLSFAVMFYYGIAIYSIFFIGSAFVGGYLGKNVAAEFEGEYERVEELASVHDRHVTCPYCGAHTVQGASTVDDQGGIHCSACGQWFRVLDGGPALK